MPHTFSSLVLRFRSYVEYRTELPVTLEITCLQFCLGLSVGEASPVCPHWMRGRFSKPPAHHRVGAVSIVEQAVRLGFLARSLLFIFNLLTGIKSTSSGVGR